MSNSGITKKVSPDEALLQHLIQAIKEAGVYNRSVLGRPKVILWTDKDCQWKGLIPALSQEMPELWVALGLDQNLPDLCRGGTATYLRYMLERDNRPESSGKVPVIYLPGIERADFRSPETFSSGHRHLYPWCHQGTFFCTGSGRDWTPVGFLSSKESAIGLEVPGDHKTKESIQLHLAELFRHSPVELKGKLLNAQTLAALFAPDPIKGMLEWIGKGNLLVKEWGDARWKAFVSVAQNQFKIHPEKDGQLSAAEKLVEGGGPWEDVWARFCESPKLYLGILPVLDQVTPKSLFGQGDNRIPSRNLAKEKELAEGLEALVHLSPHEGKNQLERLVENHRGRAQSPWAELGKSPLARAVVKLGEMLKAMQETINASNWQTAAQGYLEKGWQVDLAARHAMAISKDPASHKAVAFALEGVYRPWLTDLANRVQDLLANYPCERSSKAPRIPPEPGTLTLFVDGLRADVALELCRKLEEIGVETEKQIAWAALPTVTATAKPAFEPMVAKLNGELVSDAFEPQVDGKDKPCRTEEFRTLLKETGFTVLGKEDWGDPNQAAWQEVGSLDSKGHSEGGKLARFVDEEIINLVEKIQNMLAYGWQKIRVVTDHGWLWLPNGLPHVELPGHLTASKWGRCALVKTGAQHGLPEICWFWGNEHSVVVPPGIGVFLKKTEYTHGGVSLQECLKVHLTICNQGKPVGQVKIVEVKWTRLRLKVQLEGLKPGLMVDVRSKAADSTSSLLVDKKAVTPDEEGHATLFADDEMAGYEGALVVLDNGQVVAKHLVTVGENN
jgi:hypothetical protein